MSNIRFSYYWLLVWLAASLVVAGAVITRFQQDERTMFLPGETTHGHYQIEVRCDTCHTPFGGVQQDACLQCHETELRQANDSHPKKKFDDPRNADRVAVLDARMCTTCHVEHRPELTHAMGLTLPPDYCFRCHEDIGDERPSHQALPFNSCQTSGCHNYHDNRALYEDFLAKHLDEEDTFDDGAVPLRTEAPVAEEIPTPDAPSSLDSTAPQFADWRESAHAPGNVNCTACHVAPPENGEKGPWTDTVPMETCRECHAGEASGFLLGRHGMRIDAGLPPMTPAQARLPMKGTAAHRELTCNACHGAHDYDTRFAAVDACLTCHDDAHSRSFLDSPHALRWQREIDGSAAPGTGISCATCHLPRVLEGDRIVVQHNQNDNLRPSDKMLRDVCMACHGLRFSINALADTELVQRNFAGRPATQVKSLDWVKARIERGK